MKRYSCVVVHEPAEDPLELRLRSVGYGSSPPSSVDSVSSDANAVKQLLDDEHRQQIAIFYNGRFCVCDVTDLQARAIMGMAKNEVESNKNVEEDKELLLTVARENVEQQPGLSMKRSLQRFLQKRKARMAEQTFPYGHRKPLQLFPS